MGSRERSLGSMKSVVGAAGHGPPGKPWLQCWLLSPGGGRQQWVQFGHSGCSLATVGTGRALLGRSHMTVFLKAAPN